MTTKNTTKSTKSIEQIVSCLQNSIKKVSLENGANTPNVPAAAATAAVTEALSSNIMNQPNTSSGKPNNSSVQKPNQNPKSTSEISQPVNNPLVNETKILSTNQGRNQRKGENQGTIEKIGGNNIEINSPVTLIKNVPTPSKVGNSQISNATPQIKSDEQQNINATKITTEKSNEISPSSLLQPARNNTNNSRISQPTEEHTGQTIEPTQEASKEVAHEGTEKVAHEGTQKVDNEQPAQEGTKQPGQEGTQKPGQEATEQNTQPQKNEKPPSEKNVFKNNNKFYKGIILKNIIKNNQDYYVFRDQYLNLIKDSSTNFKSSQKSLREFYNDNQGKVCIPLLFYYNIVVCDSHLVDIDYILKNWKKNYFLWTEEENNRYLLPWLFPCERPTRDSKSLIFNLSFTDICINRARSDITFSTRFLQIYAILLYSIGFSISDATNVQYTVIDNDRVLNIFKMVIDGYTDLLYTVMKSLHTLGFQKYATSFIENLILLYERYKSGKNSHIFSDKSEMFSINIKELQKNISDFLHGKNYPDNSILSDPNLSQIIDRFNTDLQTK
jgi:hypothetical protein